MTSSSFLWLPLGFHDWLPAAQAATLGLLTFVQEDVPTVGAALLAAAGSLSWQTGFLGVFLGIWIGDALLYLLARGIGRPLLQHSWAKRFFDPAAVHLHATFFIATGFLDGGRMWNDTVIEAIRAHQHDVLDLRELKLGCYKTASIEERRHTISALLSELKYRPVEARSALVNRIAQLVDQELPKNLMMTSQQVAELHRSGMSIGAHTVNHPILLDLEERTAHSEIALGKADLERMTGSPVTLFAYPNGRPGRDYGPQHVQMVRELGFQAALSTAWGVSRYGSDIFQLPRFTPWDTSSWKYGARLMQNLLRSSVEHV